MVKKTEEEQISAPAANGFLAFLKKSSETLFTLVAFGTMAWTVSNIHSANVQLAVISSQISDLKEKVSSDKLLIMSELDLIRAKTVSLENRLNLLESKTIK